MSRSDKSSQPTEEYDADKEFGAAIKALSEAAWHLRLASYAVDEEVSTFPPGTTIPSVFEYGAVVSTSDTLVVLIEAIGTQARRLRKRAKSL